MTHVEDGHMFVLLLLELNLYQEAEAKYQVVVAKARYLMSLPLGCPACDADPLTVELLADLAVCDAVREIATADGTYDAKYSYWSVNIEAVICEWRETKDCPQLRELGERFHGWTQDAVRSAMAFNREFRAHCQSQTQLDPAHAWPWCQAMREAEKISGIYDALDDAMADWRPLSVRRQALQRVKDALGHNWWNGALPPPVPFWTF